VSNSARTRPRGCFMALGRVPAWVLVLVWMGVIAYLSHQPVYESNELSSAVAAVAIRAVAEVVPEATVVVNPGLMNHIVRKGAHVVAYMVLGFLVLNAQYASGAIGVKSLAATMLICVLFAASDEWHQTFVPGRGGQMSDVLLDSVGAVVGIVLRKVTASC